MVGLDRRVRAWAIAAVARRLSRTSQLETKADSPEYQNWCLFVLRNVLARQRRVSLHSSFILCSSFRLCDYLSQADIPRIR